MSLDDKAADAEAFFLESALKQQKASKRLIATGFCHYCGEIVQNGAMFCAATDDSGCCRDDYEAEQKAKVINGT